MKRIAGKAHLAMTAAALAAASLLMVPQAQASSGTENVMTRYRWYLQNVATQGCLDSNEEGHVYVLPCNNGRYQKWYATQIGTTWPHIFEFQNVATGRCLDDSNLGLRTWPCNGMDFQHWRMIDVGVGWRFQNMATRNCLDDSAVGVRMIACNSENFQAWWNGS